VPAAARPARHLRRDAQRNRILLVSAARSAFAELGIDVPVEEIIARAGVGTGTLYRHFPNREALVNAIFEDRVGELITVLQAALEVDDALLGLQQLLEQTIAMQRDDRVLKELAMRYPPSEGRFADVQARIEQMTEELLARAHDQGSLRRDFTRADLTILFWSLRPILDATEGVAPEAWRRHLGFVLQGLGPHSARAMSTPPLADDELAAAMQRLRAQRFERWAGAQRESDKPAHAA
jgi:AcrR family transcriptional regulator